MRIRLEYLIHLTIDHDKLYQDNLLIRFPLWSVYSDTHLSFHLLRDTSKMKIFGFPRLPLLF